MSAPKDTAYFNALAEKGTNTGPPSPPPPEATELSFAFDLDEFMHFLDEADWSEDEKIEYLTLVWNIVCEFVALGFDMHPVQQAEKACGKPATDSPEAGSSRPAMVNSSHSDLIKKYVRLSGIETGSGAGGATDE